MVENTTISKIEYGGGVWYFHDACLDIVDQINVNNLSPEQLERTKEAYHPVELANVPQGTVCDECHKPIREE